MKVWIMLLFESIEDRSVHYAKIAISTHLNVLMGSAITRYIKYDILNMLAVDYESFFLFYVKDVEVKCTYTFIGLRCVHFRASPYL